MKKYALGDNGRIFVVIGLICIAYLTVKLGDVSLLGDDTYPLFAPFTTVSGLRPGSPVNMLGIEVGRVERIALDQKDQKAIVEIRIRKGIRIYSDAIAAIKTEGLIGDKYLSIDPGGQMPSSGRRDHHRNTAGCRIHRLTRQVCLRGSGKKVE